MDLEMMLSDQFVDHLMTTQQTLNELSGLQITAADMVTQTLVNDGRIYVCGLAESDLIARQLVHRMHYGSTHERPALPACHIELPAYLFERPDNHLSHPLSAMAESKDILIIFSPGTDIQGLTALLGIAEHRGTPVILFGSEYTTYHIPDFGQPVLDIRIPAANLDRISELHWLCCNTLVNLVDKQLFGTQD